MTFHAFVDESGRGTYLRRVVVVDPRREQSIRQLVRGLLIGSQVRLHIKNESGSRQRLFLSEINNCSVSAILYTTQRRPILEGRAEILRATIPDLLEAQVDRVVLESQVGQDGRDRQVIYDALGKAGRLAGFTAAVSGPVLPPAPGR